MRMGEIKWQWEVIGLYRIESGWIIEMKDSQDAIGWIGKDWTARTGLDSVQWDSMGLHGLDSRSDEIWLDYKGLNLGYDGIWMGFQRD